MKRHTEVGQHAVHSINVIIAHEVCNEAKITVDHREARVILGGPAHGIHILVKRIQVSAHRVIETLDDGTRMTASAISGVDIDSSGLYVQSFKALWQQGRDVIGLVAHSRFLLDLKITKNLQKQTEKKSYII